MNQEEVGATNITLIDRTCDGFYQLLPKQKISKLESKTHAAVVDQYPNHAVERSDVQLAGSRGSYCILKQQ